MTTKTKSVFIVVGIVAGFTPWLLPLTGVEHLPGFVPLMLLYAWFVFMSVMLWKRNRLAYWGLAGLLLTLFAGATIPDIDNRSAAEKAAARVAEKEAGEAAIPLYAQTVVSAYRRGVKAGVIWKGETRNARIEAVCNGEAKFPGTFPGQRFRVPLYSSDVRTGASKYIGMDANGDLFYDKSGGQSES